MCEIAIPKHLVNKQNSLQTTFQWKDRKGKFHNPEDMETRHIFFTLRMIWNHSAPKSMQIEPFKKYSFSEFYTKTYMVSAIRSLSKELGTRSDLTPYFLKCLLIIKGHLNSAYGQKSIEG